MVRLVILRLLELLRDLFRNLTNLGELRHNRHLCGAHMVGIILVGRVDSVNLI